MKGVRGQAAVLVIVGICLMVPLLFAPAASATVTMLPGSSNPCPSLPQPAGMGDSIGIEVDFPYVPEPNPPRFYPGAVLRPADTATYPGKRPMVVLQHGWDEDMCSLWWAAQYLAGHGYVATIHETPFYGDPDDFFIRVLADLPVTLESAATVIDYLKGPGNAFTDYSDPGRIGYVGHGVGSIAASWITGEFPELGIGAVVALNNLHAALVGDAGAEGPECVMEVQGHPVPNVPALGMAMDRPCSSNLPNASPNLKLLGWDFWKSYNKPTMELVMRGYQDSTFVGDNDGTDAYRDVGYYLDAWFRRWLNEEPAENLALLTKTLNGRPTVDALSSKFRSAAYLPADTNTDDLSACLSGTARCDGKRPTVPVPEAEPAKLSLRIRASSHKLTRGSNRKMTVSAGNSGGVGVAVKLCVKAGPLRIFGNRCRDLRLIQPKSRSSAVFRLHASSKLKPGRRITFKATAYSTTETRFRKFRLRIVRHN